MSDRILAQPQRVSDPQYGFLSFAVERFAEAVADEGVSQEREMRIDLDSGETRPYVPNVTAKLDHSPGNAGYEGRSSRGRVDYSGLREIEPSQLRPLNKMTNDCRRGEIGRLFSPQGSVDKQGVERADPVVPLVNVDKGEHLREICRRFGEFRAGLRKAIQQRQGEREPRTGLQLLDGIERCLNASDRRPERGSHVICGGYRRLVAFCSARHIPPRSNSSAYAEIRTQQKIVFCQKCNSVLNLRDARAKDCFRRRGGRQ